MTSIANVEAELGNLKTYYLVSGIANAIVMALSTTMIVIGGAMTCGAGCLLLFLPLINLGVMIFDFVASSKVLQATDPQTYSFLRLASILDIVACFAIVPLIMGIMSLQILGKPEVRGHFGVGANGYLPERPQL